MPCKLIQFPANVLPKAIAQAQRSKVVVIRVRVERKVA